jgi:hypothetical protein
MKRILFATLLTIFALLGGGVAFADVQPATGSNFHWTSIP